MCCLLGAGAEGSSSGAGWYIENVFEELDYPTEFFYNRTTGLLYYFNNETSVAPSPETMFVVADQLVLFNILGEQDDVASNITFQGMSPSCFLSCLQHVDRVSSLLDCWSSSLIVCGWCRTDVCYHTYVRAGAPRCSFRRGLGLGASGCRGAAEHCKHCH